MLGASHEDDYVRATHRMRKMDVTRSGGAVSECIGEAFKPSPHTAGKGVKERLKIQQIGQGLPDSVIYHGATA